MRSSILHAWGCCLAASLLAACSDGGTAAGPGDDDEQPVASNVDIMPEQVSLAAIDETSQLTAVVEDQFGRPMTSAPVSWASRDAAVATVDANGLVTAVASGFTLAVATSGAAADSIAVEVNQVPVALRLLAQPANEVVDTPFETQPVVETLDANGHPVPNDYDTQVSVAVEQGAGTLTGTTEKLAEEGRVTFVNLAITGAAGDHQLAFTASALTSTSTEVFSVFNAPEQTLTGYLKNSNVGGVSYRSGAVSGVTGADGSYDYDPAESVTFSVGAVTLGTTTPGEFLTMVDLVDGGSSESPEVLNLVRFLMMLDGDGDPSNGIDVSAEVRAAAADWSLAFDDSSFDAGIQTIVSSAQSADGGSHTLPSQSDARARIEATFVCIQSGGFRGTWQESGGGDSGTLYMIIDALTGSIDGAVYNPNTQEITTFSGTSALSVDRSRTFVSGNLNNGLSFSGRLDRFGEASGSFTGGTWSATRVTNSVSAVHRYTGNYSGDDSGLFYLEIDESDNLTGTTYSVTNDETFSMTGSVNGTAVTFSLPAASTNGTGTLDTSAGTTSGNWSGPGGSGTWTGTGCKVN